MALNLGFWLVEGIRGMFHHRLTTAVTIIGMTLSLWLFALVYLLWTNLHDYRETLMGGFQFQVFLEPGTESESHAAIGEQIGALDGITKVEYVSREEAAKIFTEEFGEEVFKILEVNPLPASFKASLTSEKRTPKLTAELSRKIRTLPGVDEVIFQSGIMEQLEANFSSVFRVLILVSLLIFTGTMLIFLQGIRLSLRERRSFIYTLLMTGASHSTVKLPFIFEGITTGLIAGVIAFALILATHWSINFFIFPLEITERLYLVIAAGILLGFFTASVQVGKNPQTFLVEKIRKNK